MPGATRDVSSIAARTVAPSLTMRAPGNEPTVPIGFAINVRNIDDPEAVARLPIKMLDGASTWKVLSEHIQPDLFRSPSAKSKKPFAPEAIARKSRAV